MKVPQSWLDKADVNWDAIQKENVAVFNVDEHFNRPTQTFGLCCKMDTLCARTIFDHLQDLLSSQPELLKKLLIQPYEGYHFTLQWTSNALETIDIDTITRECAEIFQHTTSLTAHLIYPCFGRYAIVGVLDDAGSIWMNNIRSALTTVWKNQQLHLGVSERFSNLAYTSFIRYMSLLTTEEIKFLYSLEGKLKQNVTIDRVLLSISDAFMTPKHTEILQTFQLQ